MSKIQVLDCTLRDGGYCNEWKFGFENARRIVTALKEANVDIIECGFLTKRVSYNPEVTKYTTVQEAQRVLPKEAGKQLYVAMMNYGEFDPKELPKREDGMLDGIRVAFRKKDLAPALEDCAVIKVKGYKVFIQAMLSLSYSDEEFLDLIHRVNELSPYAFYIVDSFGMMKKKDLARLFSLVDHNLDPSIKIGFHSHNNMQLAYSNAQYLVDLHTKRDLIIDASVYGMGRGAGNLNTELLVEYLNDAIDTTYQTKPLLSIIDDVLNYFYQRNYWGYSLPNYLSAMYWAHPNYAFYLDEKKTLTIEAMNAIFSQMDEEKKFSYDENYIQNLYLKYMERGAAQEERLNELATTVAGKRILLIAPGQSSHTQKDVILTAMKEANTITMGVNCEYTYNPTDFIFLSNMRRYRELQEGQIKKCIITSNIDDDSAYLKVDYKRLLNTEAFVSDNAGLMAIKLLMECGVSEIVLAGFDGYSHDVDKNYIDSKRTIFMNRDILDGMNAGIRKVLDDYSQRVKISKLY